MADQAGRLITFEGKTHAFPPDATDAEISAALGAIPQVNAPTAPKAKTWVDAAVNMLPAVGATVGGVAGLVGGVPGSAAGAMLGGAGGEGFRQVIQKVRGQEPIGSAGQATTDMAKAAAVAGATDLAGGVALKGTATLGRAAAEKAVETIGADTLKGAVRAIISPRLWAKKQVISAIDSIADDIVASANPAEKLAITARDYVNISKLKEAGASEAEAVRAIVAMKAKALASKAVK